MDDKITLKNMMFYGFHGVDEHERQFGQKFFIDVEIYTDLKKAGQSDLLQDTLDYTAVYSSIKNVVEDNKFMLLERVAEKIAQAILEYNGVTQAAVNVRKPLVPIKGQLDYVEISILRRTNK